MSYTFHMQSSDIGSLEKAKALAIQLVQETTLPASVRGVDTVLSEDKDGEPAIFLNISVPLKEDRSDQEIDELRHFASELQSKLLNGGVDLFPYYRFKEAA